MLKFFSWGCSDRPLYSYYANSYRRNEFYLLSLANFLGVGGNFFFYAERIFLSESFTRRRTHLSHNKSTRSVKVGKPGVEAQPIPPG